MARKPTKKTAAKKQAAKDAKMAPSKSIDVMTPREFQTRFLEK